MSRKYNSVLVSVFCFSFVLIEHLLVVVGVSSIGLWNMLLLDEGLERFLAAPYQHVDGNMLRYNRSGQTLA